MSDTATGLQAQPDGLFKFCANIQIIVNQLKTNIIVYGKHDQVAFTFNNKNLDIVQEYKY